MLSTISTADTCISSKAIDELISSVTSEQEVVISYFVDTNRAEKISACDIICALIKQLYIQLVNSKDGVPARIHEQVENTFTISKILTTRRACKLLSALIGVYSKCLIVVDGIDAMPEAEIITLLRAVSELNGTKQQTSLRWLIFCREILGRGIRVENIADAALFYIDAHHIQQDLHHFIDQEVEQRQRESSITENQKLVDEIRTTLKANAHKMWVVYLFLMLR